VSGGQTGVDRAALDTAIALGIAHGGWCPAGRRAEDGRIPERYQLTETDSADYEARTERNVLESDGTLVLARGTPVAGTALTGALARRHRRPLLVVDLAAAPDPAAAKRWIARHRIAVLNVAGPRESMQPGIHRDAAAYLRAVLAPRRGSH
jgi:hypothetical protein